MRHPRSSRPVSPWLALIALATTLAVAGLAAAQGPPKRKPLDDAMGLEIGLRAGWFFQLNQPVTDQLMDRGRVAPDASFGVDLEAGPAFNDRLSVLIRFGYKTRMEQWVSPDETKIDDLKLVYSLVNLPSVNVKYRPFYKRFSVYGTAGLGLDLIVYDPSAGVILLPDLRMPGLGVNAGIGAEFFISSRFAIQLDLRYHLSLHGTDFLIKEYKADADAPGEEVYHLDIGPVHHTLNLYLGLEFHP